MKKIIALLILATLLTGCSKTPTIDTTSSTTDVVSKEDDLTIDVSSAPSLDGVVVSPEDEIILPDGEYYNGLNDVFVLTDSRESIEKPYAVTINSLGELQNHYENYKDRFDFTEFKTVIDEFDENYFEDKSIVLVAFSAGQSFVDHSIHSVEQKDGKLTIDIVNIHELMNVPVKENQKEWHLLLKIEKTNMSSEKIIITNWSATAGFSGDVNVMITEIENAYFIGDDLSGGIR